MQHTHIEGFVTLLRQFETVVEEIKNKPYDVLNYEKTQFDRDFLEFNVRVNDLELALQVKAAWAQSESLGLPTA